MKVLAIIDMQKDFIDGVLGTKEAVSIVPRVAARLKKAREDGETVVFTRDTHHAEYLSTQEGRNLPVPHCIEETEGWQIDAALPVLDAPVFDKPGFGSPALIEYLKRLPELERVEFIGLCTDICVITNAMMAKGALPEVPLFVRADCCAGVTPESHETVEQLFQRFCFYNSPGNSASMAAAAAACSARFLLLPPPLPQGLPLSRTSTSNFLS